MSQPRLPPLARDRWDEDVNAALRAAVRPELYDKYVSSGPDALELPNGIGVLLNHPKLAKRFLPFNMALLYRPAIEARQRELMVLRVAWTTRSTYEWVQHVRMAADAGISADEIDAIARGADADCWSPLEAALLTATDELVAHHRMSDDTWKLLAEHLDERQLVEVVFIVGTYALLAMAFNSFDLQLDAELSDVAAPALPQD